MMRLFETYADLEAALALEPSEPGAFRFLKSFGPAGFRCSQCRRKKRFPMKGGGTGYGIKREPDESESFTCYACCSRNERAALIRDGKGMLYLSGLPSFGMAADGKGLRLTDWPGGLCFPVAAHWTGRHNIARVVHFVQFRGPDGKMWTGRQYGEMTQICHVRRMKESRA